MANTATVKTDQLTKLKRPGEAYLLDAFKVVISLGMALTSSGFVQVVFIIGTALFTFSLASIIVKRHYFEIADDKLIIHENFFRKHFIDLDEIQRLILEPGPFGVSTIVLRNKKSVSFHDSHTDYKELRKLMGQFNIPVE